MGKIPQKSEEERKSVAAFKTQHGQKLGRQRVQTDVVNSGFMGTKGFSSIPASSPALFPHPPEQIHLQLPQEHSLQEDALSVSN